MLTFGQRSARIKYVISLIAFALLMASAQNSVAQFSDSYEFFEALKERDYPEMRNRIAKGANLNGFNEDGYPAVIVAADTGDLVLLEFVLDNGANVNKTSRDRRETALMRRADVNDVTTMRALVEAGADVNAEDRGGETALIKAARSRRKNAVEFLINAGADLNQADYTGQTALQYARNVRAGAIVRLLESAGAD